MGLNGTNEPHRLRMNAVFPRDACDPYSVGVGVNSALQCGWVTIVDQWLAGAGVTGGRPCEFRARVKRPGLWG
jgi:hypothetical protein